LKLAILYDIKEKNDGTDMYLKYLKKSLDDAQLEYKICNTYQELINATDCLHLYLEPNNVSPHAKEADKLNIDIPSATAVGIFNHLPQDKATTIGIIGRGLVGKQLIDICINYGYTVVEFNSHSWTNIKSFSLLMDCDVVVGLADKDKIFSDVVERIYLSDKMLIDSGNNFGNLSNKQRCGKWTREVIINRLKHRF
jgi:hypothetical protein